MSLRTPDRQTMINLMSSLLASTARGWRGTMTRPAARQPEQALELYEFEGCPFCRMVREALTELDLDAMIYPCPQGGDRFRPQVQALGGRQQFPFLVDPNTGTQLYESADIIDYLYTTYADRNAPTASNLAMTGSQMTTALRALKGLRARRSDAPKQPLELYSFESSPYSRPVRELLCELEIPYLLRSFGKTGKTNMGPPWIRTRFYPDAPVTTRNRQAMMARTGRQQVPFLIDPNTGTELYESADICRYLKHTYAR